MEDKEDGGLTTEFKAMAALMVFVGALDGAISYALEEEEAGG